ncbi:hypothetical protein HYV89_03160 [Candidatus Woesearchaeota archaeon]|nr:hypothetical protein [Candidatus Woesearchaeota archaeon]
MIEERCGLYRIEGKYVTESATDEEVERFLSTSAAKACGRYMAEEVIRDQYGRADYLEKRLK